MIFLFVSSSFAQQRIVSGQSEEDIALNVNFNGKEILVYGAIDGSSNDDFDIAITVTGPNQDAYVYKKERKNVFWLPSQELYLPEVPSYYAVISSAPLAQIVEDRARGLYKIGFRESLRYEGDLKTYRSYIEGLVRYKRNFEQYFVDEKGVVIKDDILFSGRVPLAANITEGRYDLSIYLLQNKEVVELNFSTIDVYTTGIDGFLFNLSKSNGFLYGLLSVFVALFASLVTARFTSLFWR